MPTYAFEIRKIMEKRIGNEIYPSYLAGIMHVREIPPLNNPSGSNPSGTSATGSIYP